MAQHVLLNNIDHKDLKVINQYSQQYGDNVSAVVTFPTEFGDIQKEYPILFYKEPKSGEFQSLALLGLEPNENLFLDDKGWDANYVPGAIAKGPFLIGYQEQDLDGEPRRESVIHIDLDDPRVSQDEGEPLFLPEGGNAPHLERMARVLNGIQAGMSANRAMFAAYESLGLIEPVSIGVEISETEKFNLNNYYTISEEKLANLDGASLEKLNKAGFLQGAYLVLASLSNVNKLIERKIQRRQ